MTDATVSPSAAELFRQWRQLRESGTDTATFVSQVATDTPNLTTDLERLIDAYLAGDGAAAASTLVGGAPSAEPPPKAPAIPRYTVEGYLGGGGMGEVWRVRDVLNRTWALKLVRSDRMSEAAQERFMAEARAMAELVHPHLVPIQHFDVHEDLPYFTMPPYPASLKDRLADYQADPKAAVRLMAAVADGLGFLHARGFVHRDMKPGNVLLAEDGTPKVSDFGLVKSLTDDSSPGDPGSAAEGSAETFPTGPRRSKTMLGAVLGTRAYMSPEQAAGRSDLSNPRWDVWALGVMLHELLTGRLPPSSAAPEQLLEPDAVDNPPPTSFKPGLEPRLEGIVRNCLARSEAERYVDGAAVAAALRGWSRRGRRARRLVVLAAIIVVAALAVSAAALWKPRDPIADVQARLRDGQSVELIPAAGMPVWSKLSVGDGVVQPHASEVDGALTLDSNQFVLLTLPPTGLDQYRFEVEVNLRTPGPEARAGVFAGHHRLPSADGEVDCFAALWFTDQAARAAPVPRGKWALALRSYERVAGVGRLGGEFGLDGGEFPGPAPADRQAPWHQITLDARPTGLTWTFDGRPAGSVTFPLDRSDAADFAHIAHLSAGNLPAFSPAGGYGVLVFGGAGGFRKAVVRPLD